MLAMAVQGTTHRRGRPCRLPSPSPQAGAPRLAFTARKLQRLFHHPTERLTAHTSTQDADHVERSEAKQGKCRAGTYPSGSLSIRAQRDSGQGPGGSALTGWDFIQEKILSHDEDMIADHADDIDTLLVFVSIAVIGGAQLTSTS